MVQTTLEGLMLKAVEQVTKQVAASVSVLSAMRRNRNRLISDLRDHAEQAKRVANQFRRDAGDLTGKDRFRADCFEEGLRTMSGSLALSASGVELKESGLLTMAKIANQEATGKLRAAYLGLVTSDPALPQEPEEKAGHTDHEQDHVANASIVVPNLG